MMKSLITICCLCVIFIFTILFAVPSPVRAKDPTNKNWRGLAVKGYDPVAYFTLGKPVKGKSEFEYNMLPNMVDTEPMPWRWGLPQTSIR
jgi:hypothetical protein